MTRRDDIVVCMHDCPEVISQAFVSPLLAVFQGNDFFNFNIAR